MAILKLAGFLRPRNQLLHKRLPGEGVRDSIWQHAINTLAGFSTVRQNIVADAGKLTGRVFAPYSVFKGKAALSAEPRLPTFCKLDLFALSATEVGSLISIGTRDSCEFFHDPSMLSSNAGQVRKSLSFKPNADGSGYFVSLSVVNNNLKTNDRFTVPVTTAEFAVM
ncbi:single-stranded DNA-binding protein WHY2, mitochondrial-like isoform X3 [Nicotiana tabacum]|uniref:Single-stranded DNA-binding protein WHY2, mitochondrial-like isoform X3 n=1 Tax=Nicotiana tabacum TaxID=4097 RepID=A0AC58SZV9_TOBAC